MKFYLIFIAVISFLLILDSFSYKRKSVIEVICISIIIGVVGFREYTGYDFQSYVDIYESGYFDFGYEPGFVALMNFLRSFDASYNYLFFTFAFFTYYFLYKGIKKFTSYSGISLLIFLLIPGLFLNTLTIIRQELAIVISFFAFYFLINKSYKKYFLLMLIGVSFHYSCILVIVFHLIVYKYAYKVKLKAYYLAIFVSVIIGSLNLFNIFNLLLAGGKYASYVEGEPVLFIKLFVLNSMALFYLWRFNKLTEQNVWNKYIIAFYVLSVVLINCFSSVITLTRLSYYFRIFEIILVAEYVYTYNRKVRMPILVGLCLVYLGVFISSLYADIDADSMGQPKMIPYKSVFD